MKYEYHYVMAWHKGGEDNNFKSLNQLFAQGWEPLRECAMGVSKWNIAASLVVLRRELPKKQPEGSGYAG